MKKQLMMISTLLGCLAGSTSSLYATNFLTVNQVGSDPTNVVSPGQSNPAVGVEKGLKGLRVRMQYTDQFGVNQPGGFPIDITGATVSLTVNGIPLAANCINGSINPSTGTCGFVSSPYGLSGAVDTVKVYYNGLFTSAEVIVTVSGVKAFSGTLQDSVTSPNTVRFTTGNNTPRGAVSIEAVFDTSGSMAWNTVITNPQSCIVGAPPKVPPDPNAPVCRIDALKQATDFLFQPLSAYTMLGDKIGAVFFNTSATGGALLPAHDPNQISTVQNSVHAASPGGWTAIGCGLAQAFSSSSPYAAGCNPALTSSGPSLSGDSNTRQVVLLFSDGEQNTPSTVGFNGTTLQVAGANYPATIKVCPITMGTMSALGFALQQQIATNSCNGHYLYVNGTTTQSIAQEDANFFFTQLQADVLLGDKLEIIRSGAGTLPPGVPTHTGVTPSSATEKFFGNSRDASLNLILTWNGVSERQRAPQLKLTAPDGTIIDLTGKVLSSSRMQFYQLRFPLTQNGVRVDPKGQWTAEISAIVPQNNSLDYQMIVVADNESIATDASVNITDAGTGEPIPIAVSVMDGGAPVVGATVIAKVEGPDTGLGDALAKAADPSGTPNANGDLVGSAANGKLILLLNDPNFIALLKNKGLPQVTLTDPGNTGVYKGIFNGAVKEGHYQFTIYTAGSTAANGNFERTRKVSLFVRPKPDPGTTDLLLVSLAPQTNGTALAHLRATPRDRFGSFLGPDYLPQLDITCSPACITATPITDDLHGSYDITYQIPSASANPAIGLVVMGQNVEQKPLDQLKHPPAAGKWAASFHLGATIPHGGLSAFSPSISVGGDLEYRLPHGVSLETYVGFDHFRSSLTDQHFFNLSERGKLTLGSGNLRPFTFFGVGGYFASGGSNYAGINAGGGLQYWLNGRFAVEGTYTFHNVFISGGNARYSTVLGGIRYIFK